MPQSSTRRSRGAALLALAAVLVACAERPRAARWDGDGVFASEPPAARAVEGPRADDPVVIVTIDGVRPREVFEGTDAALSGAPPVAARAITPNLHRLGSERGAFVGGPGRAAITASGPNYLSLPGYNEILSGRSSVACQDNDCPRTTTPTLLDEVRASGGKVAVFASWGLYALAASAVPGGFFVSTGRAQDPGVETFPGDGDYRPDRVTAPAALAYLAAERPDVLVLGLGDPDEHAHRGDYAGYVRAIRYADEVVGYILGILDGLGERGRRTHVVVTTDHGRAVTFRHHGRMPEAARVWLVAAGPRFHARGLVETGRERHLSDIAPTLRRVLGLPPDGSGGSGSAIEELFAER